MTQRSSQKRWDLELHLGRSLDWCLLVTMELKFDTVISMVWMDVHLTAGNSVHVDRKTLWNWSVVENCKKKHYLRKMNLISKDLDTYCWIKHNFLYYLKKKTTILWFPSDSFVSASPSIESCDNKGLNRTVRKVRGESAVYPVQCLKQIMLSAIVPLLSSLPKT